MTDIRRACALIRASNLAYAIRDDGKGFDGSAATKATIAELQLDIATLTVIQPAGELGINACYYCETTGDDAYLVFRGTLPPALTGGEQFFRILLDWLNDAQLALVKGADLAGKVHQGFLESLDALWPDILALDLGKRGKKLWVTGHSKGGALVYLAGYRLARLGIAFQAMSFAAARPGDQGFVDAYNALRPDTPRFEYQDDLVPHLPPATGAWFDALQGLQALHDRFPLEAPHLALAPNVASAANDLVKRLGDLRLGHWPGYASAGVLQFIDWKNQIVGDSLGLSVKRNLELAKLMVELRFAQIARDHSSAGGYMKIPCRVTR